MNNKVHLTIVRNPFDPAKDREFRQVEYIPGVPVKNYLQSCLLPDDWQVFYASAIQNEHRILAPEEVDTLIPESGDAFVVTSLVAGGGNDDGKVMLNIVAQIGLAMLTVGIGNLASRLGWSMSMGTMASWTTWGTLAAIGTSIAGGWLLNQWAPGPPVSESPETTYGWGQIESSIGEGAAIPITFGEIRVGGQLLNYHITHEGDKQYLNLLYSGGEGPCDYIDNGEADPDKPDNVPGIGKILINGNPVENYNDIKIYKRAGLNDQSIIPNFNDTFAEQALAFELQKSIDWTTASTAVTTGKAGGFEIILEMPGGCYRSGKNGLANAKVIISMRYRPYQENNQLSWINYDEIVISDQTTKPIYRTVKVDNLDPVDMYEVQCRCSFKSGDDSSYSTRIFWRTLTSITYDDFIRPNKILLGIKALATDQLSGGMPNISWVQRRSKSWVWNSNTQTYEQKDLSIPAWAAYDLLCRVKQYKNIHTDEMEFVVEGIDTARIDYAAFEEAAEYQSRIINGERRCACNFYLDQSMTLWEALKSIEEVGRFKILPRGTKYSCVTDKPMEAPVQIFTVGNTALDSFTETFVDTAKRANAIEIRFRNRDKDYEWDTAVETTKDYDDSQAVPNPVQVTLSACTGLKQAHREGAYRLRQNQLITRTVSHSADIDAIACQVGDVYFLQRDVPTWGAGGRVVEATDTMITLDAPVTLIPGKMYSVLVRMANDTLIQKPVVNPAEEEAVELQTFSLVTPFMSDRHVPTYIDVTHFSVPGDCTGIYSTGKQIEIGYGFSLTAIDTVIASVFEDDFTTVQVSYVPKDINSVRFDYTLPGADDVYSFGETKLEAKPFRVVSITRDGDLKRKITGIEYVEAAYDELINVPIPDYTGSVENIRITANRHIDSGGVPWLDLSWTTPRKFYFGARVELNGKRAVKVDNAENSCSILLEAYGIYHIKVTATDLFGGDITSAALTYEVKINDSTPPEVTDLTLSEDTFILRDGTVITDVDVLFNRPENFYKAFNVYYSSDGLQWKLAGQTTGGFYKIKSTQNTGKITVKVCTVSPFDVESKGVTASVELVGKSQPPSDVTGFKALQDEFNRARVVLSWGAVDPDINPDLKGYEVRVGEGWKTGSRIGGVVYGLQTDYTVPASGNYTFFIRALDNSGNYSSRDAMQSITVEAKPNAPTAGKAVQDVRDSTYVILNWSAVDDKDLAGYEIKQGSNWDAATWIDSTKETTYRLKFKSSGTCNFMVRARNNAGFFSSVLNIPITASIEPPDVNGFTVTQKTSDPSQIRFKWDKPTPLDIAYYEIREGTTWDEGEIVASYIIGLFYDAVINNESPKTFWIKAINVGGMYSQYPTKYLSIFELNPSTPTGLTINQDSNDRAVLLISWTGIPDLDLNEYELRQGATWETGLTVIKTKELQTTWTPSASGDYKFMLKAKNNAGYYSDEVFTHFYATLEPKDVTGFMAIQNGAAVLLTWEKHSEPDVTGYEIREGSQFDNGSLIATGIPGTSWETPVDTETTKQYYIKALNRARRYSLNAAGGSVTITNLPPKNVVYSYDELSLQTGTHQNTEFGSSIYTFASFGGKFSDYPTTRFSDVGGLTVLKLKKRNLIRLDTAPGVLMDAAQGTVATIAPYEYNGISGYRVTMTSKGGWGAYLWWDIQGGSLLDLTAQYSFSVYAVALGNGIPIRPFFANGNSLNVALSGTAIPTTGDLQRFKFESLTVYPDYSPGSSVIKWHLPLSIGDIFVANPQLEIGETATVFDSHFDSGFYLCQRKDMGSVITANIGSQFVSSVLLSAGVSAILQYRLSRDGTTWTDWVDFVPVQATFRYIDFRVLLRTSDLSKTPEVNILTESIDVPDVDKYGTATVAAGGTDVPFGYTYWQAPVVTPTAIGQGLRAELVSVSKDKFRVRVLNSSGADAGGTINWIARGF